MKSNYILSNAKSPNKTLKNNYKREFGASFSIDISFKYSMVKVAKVITRNNTFQAKSKVCNVFIRLDGIFDYWIKEN